MFSLLMQTCDGFNGGGRKMQRTPRGIGWHVVLITALFSSAAAAQTAPPAAGTRLLRTGDPTADYVQGSVFSHGRCYSQNCDFGRVYGDDGDQQQGRGKLTMPGTAVAASAIAVANPSSASAAGQAAVTGMMEAAVGTIGVVANADVGPLSVPL